MDIESMMKLYYRFLEEHQAFPVQGNLQTETGERDKIRHWVEKMVKLDIFTKNAYGNLLPGPNFVSTMESLNFGGKFFSSKAGSLCATVLSTSSKTVSGTFCGVVSRVGSDRVDVVWLDEGTDSNLPSSIATKALRRLHPIKVGDKFYMTKGDYTFRNFSRENN